MSAARFIFRDATPANDTELPGTRASLVTVDSASRQDFLFIQSDALREDLQLKWHRFRLTRQMGLDSTVADLQDILTVQLGVLGEVDGRAQMTLRGQEEALFDIRSAVGSDAALTLAEMTPSGDEATRYTLANRDGTLRLDSNSGYTVFTIRDDRIGA